MSLKFTEMVKLGEMAKLSIDARQDAKYSKEDGKWKDPNGEDIIQNIAIHYAFKYWPPFQVERDKLEELDKYVGRFGLRNTSKAPIKVLFDTGSDKIKKDDTTINWTKDNDALWTEIEMRNEAELCKLAIEEYEKISEPIKQYWEEWKEWNGKKDKELKENPLKKAAQILARKASNGETLHIDYLFLQACYGVYGGATGTGDGVDLTKSTFLRKRFLDKFGCDTDDFKNFWELVYEVGYFSFLFGKDLWGAQNESRIYAEQFDDTGNIFDKNNRNSRIVHIAEQFDKNPFNFDKRFKPITWTAIKKKEQNKKKEQKGNDFDDSSDDFDDSFDDLDDGLDKKSNKMDKGTRKFLDPRTDNKEMFDKYALWLCRGRYNREEIKKIMAEDFAKDNKIAKDDIPAKVEERFNKIIRDDVDYISENFWTTTTAKPLIALAANFATTNFNNAKRNILHISGDKEQDPTIRYWLENLDAYHHGLDENGIKITDKKRLAYLRDMFNKRYLKDKSFYNRENQLSLDATMSGKDGEESTTYGAQQVDKKNRTPEEAYALKEDIQEIKEAIERIPKDFNGKKPYFNGMFEMIINMLKYPYLSISSLAKVSPHLINGPAFQGRDLKHTTLVSKYQYQGFFSNFTRGGWVSATDKSIYNKKSGAGVLVNLGLGSQELLSDMAFVMNNIGKLDDDEEGYAKEAYENLVNNVLPQMYRNCYGINYVDVIKNNGGDNVKYNNRKATKTTCVVSNPCNPSETLKVSVDLMPRNCYKSIMNTSVWKQKASIDMNKEYRYIVTEESAKKSSTQAQNAKNVAARNGKEVKHSASDDEFDESIFIDIYNLSKLN